MVLELVIWVTVGALLNAVGYSFDTWQFWCFLATYWCVSVLSRSRGKIEGMIDYLEMNQQDQERIKQALKQAKENLND